MEKALTTLTFLAITALMIGFPLLMGWACYIDQIH